MDGISLDSSTLNLPVGTANHLRERYERLMIAVSSEHPGDICDEAKALLECVFRTIITNRNGHVDEGPNGRATFIGLYEQAWDTLNPTETSDLFKKLTKKSCEAIGAIRNDYGGVSHGQDGYDERTIGLEESLYIARSTLTIAGYMYSHHIHVSRDARNSRIHYEDNPDFNEYLDSDGDINVAGVLMPPSQVLYNNDIEAYKEQLIEYTELMREQAAEDEINAAAELYIQLEGDIQRGK